MATGRPAPTVPPVGLRKIISPAEFDRPYGPASAAFLFLMVFSEIEGLAFLVIGLVLRRPELFLDLQSGILPAAFIVAAATACVVLWRSRYWLARSRMNRYTKEVGETMELVRLGERFGRTETRRNTG